MSFVRLSLAVLALAGLLTSPPVFAQGANPARLAQLVDYVGVDYAVAVKDGEVISNFEYGEMREFAGLIVEQAEGMPAETREQLLPLATQLRDAIETKADPSEVSRLATAMTEILLRSPALQSAPAATPDLAAAEHIYAQQCAACHGASGQGDGPAVTPGMEPAPTDFTDTERAHARSLYGLYNTITLGVEGTAMPSFEHLPTAERWALAFYVGGLYADAETLANGERAFTATPDAQLPRMAALTTATPAGLAEQKGDVAADIHAWLRRNPAALEALQPDPLAVAMAGIRRSVDLYAAGEPQAAHDAAIDAYLEGFELAEAALSTTQPDLVLAVESAMTDLRLAIRNRLAADDVRAAAEEALALLQDARDSRTGESLSSGVAFASSLVIMLREGLEAILVLGAIAAFLGKTGRRDAMAWLHGGWIAALAVGVLTWAVSNYFITISGATREVTEGVTALVAAGVLFYVGFWMHSKLNARRWQEFIQHSVQKALDQKGLWAIAGIAFIAVYREVFETVLFYQALWAQVTAPAAESAMLGGAIAGAAIIVGLAWAIFRFGIHLPLKQFFGATAAIMIALAVIFAGKGVAALQEAGRLPLDPVAFFPRIELLGIYPTLQSLGVQFVVLAAALALIVYNARSSRTASS
ncbi:MAG TPA: cytochrome c/FTR1 family iron permease [Gammaproteobacteria bacterium]